MAEERTPAGWYPDPSGLPQLRWWDNHKWTEFVSDSQLEDGTADAEAQPVDSIPASTGAHAASHSATASAERHTASGYAAEHAAAAHIAAQAARSEPAAHAVRPEPAGAQPAGSEPAAYAVHSEPAAHPIHSEPVRPEPAAQPVRPEPIIAEPATRYDAGPRVDPSTAPDLRSAFDAMFTEPAPEPASAPEPSLVEAFDQTFGYATPGVPDPAEALFAASATSPIGVGTGETIGEALMRALQSA